MDYIRTQTLILSVWHHDTFGRNSFLGEVDVDLSKWDFDHAQMNYLPLKARVSQNTPTQTHTGRFNHLLFSHQITAAYLRLWCVGSFDQSLLELVVSETL